MQTPFQMQLTRSVCLAFCLGSLLQACSNLAEVPVLAVQDLSALSYYEWLTNAEPAAVEVEKMKLQQLTDSTADRHNRVRYALVLGLSNDITERNHALALLAENPDSTLLATSDDYQRLGRLWASYLQLLNLLDKVSAELADAASAYRELAANREGLENQMLQQKELLATMESNSRLLESQYGVLLRQLDALTAIEQELMAREPDRNNAE